MNGEVHPADLAAVQADDALLDALRLCETFTSGRCLDPNSGRTRGAEYGADAWCAPCVAADALSSALNDSTRGPDGDRVAQVLMAWRRDVDSEPITRVMDTDTALAVVARAHTTQGGRREHPERALLHKEDDVSIQSVPYYWIVCDSCGAKCPSGGDDYSAWGSVDQAVDYAHDSEWSYSEQTNRHHCPDCERFCEKCGFSASGESGERDYLCWADAQCAVAVGLAAAGHAVDPRRTCWSLRGGTLPSTQ